MAFRGFIAVDIEASDSLREFWQELRNTGAQLKLVDLDKLHLTLKFLGETREDLVPEIEAAMRRACEGISPFEATLKSVGAFPSLTRINVVWVGMQDQGQLGSMALEINKDLSNIGFEGEGREFLAHITVARVKGGRNKDKLRSLIERRCADSFGVRIITQLKLKKSELSPEGPHYSDVTAVDLV